MIYDENEKSKRSGNLSNREQRIHIKFETYDQTLFDLAYIALDLNQFLLFAELISDNQYDIAKKLFLKNNHYPFTRQNKILNEYSSKIKVESIQNGCIDIVINGVSIMATVLTTYLGILITRHLSKQDERLQFNVSPEDQELNQLINKYAEGCFGKSDDDLQWFINYLSDHGYNIELTGYNIYLIESTLKKYERRIVKTIKKY